MPQKIADTGNPILRQSGIGGSDVAAIVGVSRWSTAMDVWLAKTGQAAPLIPSAAMEWGNLLEDPIARKYAKETGRKVVNASATLDWATGLRARVIRPWADKPWRMAHVDRLVSGESRGLEVKTARFAGDDWGEQGTDQVPPDYRLQVAWYMALTQRDVWDIAVLIGGSDFRIYTIERDLELEEMLFKVVDDFWLTHVLPRVAPPIDGSEATRRYLESRHTAPEVAIPMSDRLYELALAYESVQREIKDAEARKDALANGIREQMGEAGKAARDNAKVSWTVARSRRLDTTALAEAHPDIVRPFYVESESHRLTVSVKEQGA